MTERDEVDKGRKEKERQWQINERKRMSGRQETVWVDFFFPLTGAMVTEEAGEGGEERMQGIRVQTDFCSWS